jgi:hypothetical protein
VNENNPKEHNSDYHDVETKAGNSLDTFSLSGVNTTAKTMKSSSALPAPPATSRRDFLRKSGLLAAAAALAQSEWMGRVLVPRARAEHGPDSVTDTFNGLAAFIVPGNDPYSAHQGVSDAQPGAVSACVGPFLAGTLDLLNLAPPPFPGFGALAAFILNNVGQAVNPAATGPFDSHFANLSFGEKAGVFAVMESGQAGAELVPLGGILPYLTAFIAYSEAGLLAPDFCTLNGVPVGWATSGYEGVADGRDDFQGYFEGRASTV